MLVSEKHIQIIADYRETASAIPVILKDKGAIVELRNLRTGDYLINNSVLVERKSRDDFILSIIQDRLFAQCARLKKSGLHCLLLVEGNPYQTSHKIERNAIKGALLSVSLSWQVPIVYSSGPTDSADILLMAGEQLLKSNYKYLRRSDKSKSLKNKAVFFLQGLPGIGQKTAGALLERFGTPENVVLATEDELLCIEGLGKEKVKRIREFLRNRFHPETSS
ncbi:MAG: hypothetical protein JW798_13635 [Prolixibacteraceae bacterium]|nr:hypothetical protein [Prolixibacteraceae bacterium]